MIDPRGFQRRLDNELADRGFRIPHREWDTPADTRRKNQVQQNAFKSIPRGNIVFKKVLQLGAINLEEDEVRKAFQQCFREHLDVNDKIFKKVQEKLNASESDGRSPAMEKALKVHDELLHLDHDVLRQMLEDENWFDFFYTRAVRVVLLVLQYKC